MDFLGFSNDEITRFVVIDRPDRMKKVPLYLHRRTELLAMSNRVCRLNGE